MRTVVLVGLVLVAIVGCGGGTDQLSRDQAKELISQRLAEVQPDRSPYLCKGSAETGVQLGLWSLESVDTRFGQTTSVVLTEKGKQYIEIGDSGLVFRSYKGRDLVNQLKVPLRPTVREVTGIADAGGADKGDASSMKIVEFDWTYLDVPSEIAAVISRGGKGKVLLRLYDDGWRVEGNKSDLFFAIHSDVPETTSEECLE